MRLPLQRVTDHDIHRAAPDRVCSLDELQMRTGCADCCGWCETDARSVLETAVRGRLHILPVAVAA